MCFCRMTHPLTKPKKTLLRVVVGHSEDIQETELSPFVVKLHLDMFCLYLTDTDLIGRFLLFVSGRE